MQLIDKTQLIQLDNDAFSRLKLSQDIVEYVKQNTLVTIKKTRIENIMFDLIFSLDERIPDDLTFYFFDEHFQSSVISPKIIRFLPHELSEDKQNRKIKILDIEKWDYRDPFLVQFIGFGLYNSENDFNFWVDINRKWTYKIFSDRINDEFCFTDGLCHHEIGDNFPYHQRKGVELVVREKDERLGIVYCSALGFM
jgi:hypothetical protein